MIKCIPKEILAKLKEDVLKGRITAEQLTKMLPDEREALKSILEDYVAEKLGVKVKNEEVQAIKERADKIEEAQVRVGNDIGVPSKLKENLDFFKAKREMENYLLSLSPAHNLKVATGTIGRGMMLASLKSPILNIGSNLEVGFTEAVSRRIASGSLKTTDNALFKDYVKFANKIYKETGYDVSRMTDLADLGSKGSRVLEDTVHSEGPGKIRAAGRFVEDIVFKKMMGAPDVAFSSAHFADSLNLRALDVTKGDKVEAKSLMEDAMRIEPQTAEGKILRNQAILDAQVATWTNTSWASRVSSGIRKILNDVTGDARLGDYVLPFIKTGSNVIATGMDYAGMGIPKAFVKTIQAIRKGELNDKVFLQSAARDMVRAGLGLTGAAIIAANLGEDDFVGAYDPKRSQIESLRNSNYNAIRIGNKWISTDWLGPLAIPVTAIMYSKKYGKTYPERLFQYSKGLISAAADIPGIKDIKDFVKTQSFNKNQTLEEMMGATSDYITSNIYSRLVPSIFSDFAKAVDPKLRETGGGLQGIKSKIPFVSKTLPEKKNIFGESLQGESLISDILFGSRVKTDKETALVKEISSVSNATDKGIAFTDWSKSSSKTLGQFKDKVGPEKYKEAQERYGKELKKQLERTIANPIYQKLSNEDKLKVLNGKDTDAMDFVFRQYGFRYKTLPTMRLPMNL